MDFHSLSRKELQALCKKNKIPANLTNVAMADALNALQNVEGICENPQPQMDSPQKIEIQSPDIARTCWRTSTRRNPVKDVAAPTNNETESSLPLTRTRRGTRKIVQEGEQERKDTKDLTENPIPLNGLELPETPVVTQNFRKRTTGASVRRKIETHHHLKEDKEGKDVKQEEENPVIRPYSTRRSTRLSEKRIPESNQRTRRGGGRTEAIKIAVLSEEENESKEEGSDVQKGNGSGFPATEEYDEPSEADKDSNADMLSNDKTAPVVVSLPESSLPHEICDSTSEEESVIEDSDGSKKLGMDECNVDDVQEDPISQDQNLDNRDFVVDPAVGVDNGKTWDFQSMKVTIQECSSSSLEPETCNADAESCQNDPASLDAKDSGQVDPEYEKTSEILPVEPRCLDICPTENPVVLDPPKECECDSHLTGGAPASLDDKESGQVDPEYEKTSEILPVEPRCLDICPTENPEVLDPPKQCDQDVDQLVSALKNATSPHSSEFQLEADNSVADQSEEWHPVLVMENVTDPSPCEVVGTLEIMNSVIISSTDPFPSEVPEDIQLENENPVTDQTADLADHGAAEEDGAAVIHKTSTTEECFFPCLEETQMSSDEDDNKSIRSSCSIQEPLSSDHVDKIPFSSSANIDPIPTELPESLSLIKGVIGSDSDNLQHQIRVTPRKSSTKKQTPVPRTMKVLEDTKENNDNIGSKLEFNLCTVVAEEKENQNKGEDSTQKALKSTSLRQLRKMFKEKLQICDNANNKSNKEGQQLGSRTALQTLTENCLVMGDAKN